MPFVLELQTRYPCPTTDRRALENGRVALRMAHDVEAGGRKNQFAEAPDTGCGRSFECCATRFEKSAEFFACRWWSGVDDIKQAAAVAPSGGIELG
jgi:hypothetical protein